jgi:hypothetical protein
MLRPTATSGAPKTALREATRKSRTAASARPPPRHGPSIAATVTGASPEKVSSSRRPVSARTRRSSRSPSVIRRVASSRRLRPALNTASRPATTTTAVRPSSSNRRAAATRSRITATDKGFARLGPAKRTIAMPSRRSTVTAPVCPTVVAASLIAIVASSMVVAPFRATRRA